MFAPVYGNPLCAFGSYDGQLIELWQTSYPDAWSGLDVSDVTFQDGEQFLAKLQKQQNTASSPFAQKLHCWNVEYTLILDRKYFVFQHKTNLGSRVSTHTNVPWT